jgi:hypothetical protein
MASDFKTALKDLEDTVDEFFSDMSKMDQQGRMVPQFLERRRDMAAQIKHRIRLMFDRFKIPNLGDLTKDQMIAEVEKYENLDPEGIYGSDESWPYSEPLWVAIRLEQSMPPPGTQAHQEESPGGRQTEPANVKEAGTMPICEDPISTSVAVQKYAVSKVTLRRAVKDGRLRDCRLPGAAKNSPLMVSGSEVAKYWPQR